MQKSTTKKINENTNTDNYNRKDTWERMMSEHEMSTASFMTEFSQKLLMIQWKNRMRTVSTNLR